MVVVDIVVVAADVTSWSWSWLIGKIKTVYIIEPNSHVICGG